MLLMLSIIGLTLTHSHIYILVYILQSSIYFYRTLISSDSQGRPITTSSSSLLRIIQECSRIGNCVIVTTSQPSIAIGTTSVSANRSDQGRGRQANTPAWMVVRQDVTIGLRVPPFNNGYALTWFFVVVRANLLVSTSQHLRSSNAIHLG